MNDATRSKEAAFLRFGLGLLLGILIGTFLCQSILSNPKPQYDRQSCLQANGQYRRIVTGDRYVCYFPKKDKHPMP